MFHLLVFCALFVIGSTIPHTNSDERKQISPNCTSLEISNKCSGNFTQQIGIEGLECTIESFAYPDNFLSMKSGWWYKYAILEKGNPRRDTSWNWRAVWQISTVDVEGEKLFLLKDQKNNRYLSFNKLIYNYLRGESNPRMMDNLWKIARVSASRESVTLQRHLTPREYLHASWRVKGDERQLEMHEEPHADADQWLIHCSG